MHRLAAAAGIAAAAGLACAQSFNVDLNRYALSGPGSPYAAAISSSYGGFAGSPGVWNLSSQTGPTTMPIVAADGRSTGATFTRPEGGMTYRLSDVGAPEYDKLAKDGQLIGDAADYVFSGLEAGRYLVFTYGQDPEGSYHLGGVSVDGSASLAQGTGGAFTPGIPVPDSTHAVHYVQVAHDGGAISIRCTRALGDTFGYVSGFQIVKLDAPTVRLHVDDGAPAAGNGSGWSSAWPSLQAALAQARNIGPSVCEVWVAQGSYTPGAARYDAFDIPSGLKMYGGFLGHEASLEQRGDVRAAPSTLSGNIGNILIPSDNAYTVVHAYHTAPGTLLDGFRIQGANNDQPTGGMSRGGGIRVRDGELDVRRCDFILNHAEHGGAIWADNADVTLVDCLFDRNAAEEDGGAIRAEGDSGVRIVNSRFVGNDAGDGGAIYTTARTSVFGSFFSGNDSSDAVSTGAITAAGPDAELVLTNCTFAYNYGKNVTGGVYLKSGAQGTVRNSIFWGNRAFPNDFAPQHRQVTTDGPGSPLTTGDSIIEGILLGFNGNTGADPRLVGVAGPDGVRGTRDDRPDVEPGSPAVDSGAWEHLWLDFVDADGDGVSVERIPLDVAGNPRVVDIPGVGAAQGAVDRGAFEVQERCLADFNGDGSRTVQDLIAFLQAFGAKAQTADVNADQQVSVQDLIAFLQAFGAGC